MQCWFFNCGVNPLSSPLRCGTWGIFACWLEPRIFCITTYINLFDRSTAVVVMGMKINKTNAARLLDRAHIAYELVPYEVDEEHLAAAHVAEQLNEDIAQVFKTLVLRGDRTGILVCVIPGDGEVNLKLAAKVSGNKSVEMLHMKELLPTTGYIRGGCSPIGMKKHFPTYFHKTCLDFHYIYVSAGVRGIQIKIDPADLIKFVSAEVGEIAI